MSPQEQRQEQPRDQQADAIDHHHPSFEVDVDDLDGDVVRVQVSGDIDIRTLGHLDDTLGSLGEEDGCRHVVVDVSRVTFLSACGVSKLVAAQHTLGVHGRSLALHRTTAHQRRLLRIGGFDSAHSLSDDAAPVGEAGRR